MNILKAPVVLLVPSILFGCHCLPDGAGLEHPTAYHTRLGIAEGEPFMMTVERPKCGWPMPERYTQPHFRVERPSDFTGWAWWPASSSTAAGIRYEAGRPVEYAYGFNHWKELFAQPLFNGQPY